VVQGYLAIIDGTKLGYETYHIFIKLDTPNKIAKKELIEKIKTYPFIKAIIEYSGKYDLEISVISKDILSLDGIITKIYGDLSNFLRDMQVLIISKPYESRIFPKSFLLLNKTPSTKKVNYKVDQKDLRILQLISSNANIPLYKISNALNIPADTISYRLNRMEKSEVIKKYIPIINFAALGYTVYVLLMKINNLNPSREKTLHQFLKENKNILWAVKTIGSYNLLAYICVKESEQFHETLIQLKELFSENIIDYETLIAYEEHGYNYFPEVYSEGLNDKVERK
jgi:Lrp/AsnC family transcriptional regulator, regulator for asnA, asnC and gidA